MLDCWIACFMPRIHDGWTWLMIDFGLFDW